LTFASSSLLLLAAGAVSAHGQSWPKPPKFRVVALAERASGDHQKFVDVAKIYLNKLAAENDFAVDYISGTGRVDEEFLAQYKLFIQLNHPPYHWTPIALVALLYLAVVGSVNAFMLYYWLVHNMDVTKSMLIALVTPVVAVVLGMVVLGEDLSWRTVAGGVMIMAGVRFVTRISLSSR